MILSDMLDYSHKVASHSSPLMVKLGPLNNQTSTTLSVASVVGPVQFVIPSKCINLARSIIQFDINVPAMGAGIYSWVQANFWDLFYRINLVGQSTNTQLLDLAPVDRYASSLIPVSLKNSDFYNKASPYGASVYIGYNTTNYNTTQASGQFIPVQEVSRNYYSSNVDGVNNDTLTPYDGIRLLYSGNASNTQQNITVSMELGSLPHNIMALDKLMYFGSEQLELNLYFNPCNRWSWGNGTSNTVPSYAGTQVTTPAAATLNNMAIYLYTEQDATIIQGLVERAMGDGYSIKFAYPLITRQALSGNNQTINTQLTRGLGSSLLFIATSWYNSNTYVGSGSSVQQSNAETLNTAQDHSLFSLLGPTASTSYGSSGNPCTGAFSAFQYQAQIDSINILTNNQYNAFLGEPWLYNQNWLNGSAIKSANQYYVQFTHIDNFTGSPICMIDQTVDDGLSLENYRQHQMSFTATAAGTPSANVAWYVFYICTRTLNISSQGLLVN